MCWLVRTPRQVSKTIVPTEFSAADDAKALGRGFPTPYPMRRDTSSKTIVFIPSLPHESRPLSAFVSRHETRGLYVAESDVPCMITAVNRSQIANRQSAIARSDGIGRCAKAATDDAKALGTRIPPPPSSLGWGGVRGARPG